MLIINHLRIEIQTDSGLYGFETTFGNGLNIIASDDNTRGKTSIIESILYCLGCEEILGGQGIKVLTPVYTSELTDDSGNIHHVLQSDAYLEISNGKEIITIHRAIKSVDRKEKLITVYMADYANIHSPETKRMDYFVQSKGAATNSYGYHKFLNDFLELKLPVVYDNNDCEHQLYIQQVLAALFIEQKGGYIDILNRAPYFGIAQVKKRVMEYLLGLDTNKAEHERRALANQIIELKGRWKQTIKKLELTTHRFNGELINVPAEPVIITDEQLAAFKIMIQQHTIEEHLQLLQSELQGMSSYTPKIRDDYDALHMELQSIQEKIAQLQAEMIELQERKRLNEQNISRQKHLLNQIYNDIRNNQDAKKLKGLGSTLGLNFATNRCPTCNQEIDDCLLSFETPIMSIDDNITHLNAQKQMIEFSINSHTKGLNLIETNLSQDNQLLLKLEKLALSLRTDISSVEDNYSEASVRKKIHLQDSIDEINNALKEIHETRKTIHDLSEEYRSLLTKREMIESQNNEDSVRATLKEMKSQFVEYLYLFGYGSINDKERIDISPVTLLPSINDFDMKFGSSASDNVRMIWAFTLSILKQSQCTTHCLNFAVFDEPKQQSIVNDNFDMFIKKAIKICQSNGCQIIIGVTAKDKAEQSIVNNAKNNGAHIVDIIGRAFKPLD